MEMVLLNLVICGLLAWWGSSLAKTRNRSPVTWGIVCFVIGIFGVIIIAILGKIEPAMTVDEAEALIKKEGL